MENAAPASLGGVRPSPIRVADNAGAQSIPQTARRTRAFPGGSASRFTLSHLKISNRQIQELEGDLNA